MPKVLCTLPNASEEISGVKFVTHADGMVSEEISDEVAENFLSIPGYLPLVDSKAAEKAAADAAAEAEKAELLERAAKIEFTVKANWSVARLKTEVETAEAAAKTE